MDPQYEKIVKSYQAHSDSVSFEKQLNLGVPGKPNPELSLDDKLTLPPFGPNTPEALKCSNSKARKDHWLAMPHSRLNRHTFFALLGHLCVAAKLRECRRKQCLEFKEAMESVAPACDWESFRDWAMVAMSCQQAFTMEEKLSVAHTHLVNVVFSCHELVDFLDDIIKMPIRRTMKKMTPTVTTLMGVCNVVFWMVTIQQSMGLVPRGYRNPALPGFLTGPAILIALGEMESMKVCRNRLWNMLEVSERKQSDLPDIMNALRSRPFIRHEGHNLCTQTKCQDAHINSTRVGQLHKNPEGDRKQCRNGCTQYIYPVDLLPRALEKAEQTAWSRTTGRLILLGESYIAISHVWSDGTGIGRKAHGSVNSCLFDYFAAITKELDCGGIWWDALSIPTEPEARSKALSKMHTNYYDAKCTVVHDLFLLNLEWTDRESACLALVLSPWFTRGWTALELAMSRDVKVLFKGRDPMTPDIRDLETDILAREPSLASRAHWLASCVIRRLRGSVRSLSDLLAILRPRSTSWVRDRTVIASLLADVPSPDFTLSESEITQSLIKHLGLVSHETLLHGRPTMTDSGGFSWCPATLDDMPIEVGREFDTEMLAVQDDGSVVGDWVARPVSPTDIRNRRVQPHGSDISAVTKVEAALLDWSSCLLLYQALGSDGPALLVTTLEVNSSEDGEPIINCRYVGAVRDSRPQKRDIINISKFEGDQDFRPENDKDDDSDDSDEAEDDDSDDSDDDEDEGGEDDRVYDEDSDGDGDRDYNNFRMFRIRLGKDSGKEGARAWDILRKAWMMTEATDEE
ncbi:hypothetical protein V8E54_005705 [Elaphomyces granulatus]